MEKRPGCGKVTRLWDRLCSRGNGVALNKGWTWKTLYFEQIAVASVQRIEQKIRSRQSSEDKCQALARHGHGAQVVTEMKQTWRGMDSAALPMESPELRMKYQKCMVRRHCRDRLRSWRLGGKERWRARPTEVHCRGWGGSTAAVSGACLAEWAVAVYVYKGAGVTQCDRVWSRHK